MQTISPSKISGLLKIPASKSYMQRTVLAAMLSDEISEIENPCYSDDSKNILKIAEELGAKINKENNKIFIKGGINPVNNIINVGESGLTLRMIIPILSVFNKKFIVSAHGSLLKRPIDFVEIPLKQLGAKIEINNNPIIVQGPIKGGKIEIEASVSSQFLSGLLFALPLLKEDSEIFVKKLKSKPYIDLTIEILKKFGIVIENEDYKHFKIKGNQKYISQKIKIESDWSSAAFMMVAAAISGKIELNGLNINSKQADMQIISVLKKAGADIETDNKSMKIRKSPLKAFSFDATHFPDLFPPLVALALNCNGRSVIKGVERLLYKESNRANALINEFTRLGAKIEIQENEMIIYNSNLNGGKVHSNNDHRIAMSLAIAALNASDDVIIENSQCVSKSYPQFFEDLDMLCSFQKS